MQKSMPALVHAAREIWYDLNPSRDWEEAFRGHPRIGDDPVKLKEKFPSSSGDWAMGEQSNAMATATEETLRELGEMNVKYEQFWTDFYHMRDGSVGGVCVGEREG